MQISRHTFADVKPRLRGIVVSCFAKTSHYRTKAERTELMNTLSQFDAEFVLGKIDGKIVGFACGMKFTKEHLRPGAHYAVFKRLGAKAGDYYFSLVGLAVPHRNLANAMALYNEQVSNVSKSVVWAKTLAKNMPVRVLLERAKYDKARKKGDTIYYRKKL